ncbi:MAG: hypothetical protein ABFD80_03310 [Acidobacteriota bacterium]
MMIEPAETTGTPAAKAKPSILALVIGAATIIYALVRDLQAIRAGEAVVKSVPLAISSSLPWLGAGIALVVRAVRGALPWPRAIASWAGGFFIGAIGLVAGVAFLGGPSDSMTWFLHTLGFVLFLVLGIVLLKIGFKRKS